MLVATEDALDQYFMREPDKLLGRRVEAAILDHANPRVLAGHVRAAAFEAPIDDGDAGDPRAGGARGRGRRPGAARRRRAASSGPASDYPGGARRRCARPSPTRSRSSTRSTGAVLGLVERSRAYSTVHEGAVYLHLGESYLVRELDETTMRAVVEPFRGDWYTQAKKETETDDRRGRCARSAAAGSTSSSARSR